jgi:TonB family protein
VRDVSPAEERDSTTYVPSEGAAPVNLTKAGTSDPARCPAPFSAAQISAAAPVLYPDIAREQGATGVAVVLVAVAPDGSSAATQVVTSSGSGALDESASHAARATKYRAAVFDCEPIADSFLFHAEFTIQTDAKPLSLPLP